MKARKKVNIVEYFPAEVKYKDEILSWSVDNRIVIYLENSERFWIRNSNGTVISIKVGEGFIIRENNREIYICSNRAFDELYESTNCGDMRCYGCGNMFPGDKLEYSWGQSFCKNCMVGLWRTVRPIEAKWLQNAPEMFKRCPVCGVSPFVSFMRGEVQSKWKKLFKGWGFKYCAVICRSCKVVVGHERPDVTEEEMKETYK